MVKGGAVYIMTDKNNSVLYVGVTSELWDRVYQHKNNVYPSGFTSRYCVYKLVYYRYFFTIEEAIAEEKRIKGGSRANKLRLIMQMNPGWKDLGL